MPQFVEHTSVIDAASDVLVEVFGEAGCHSRLAVGVSSLPANLTLEIEAQILVKGS
jgi:enamine deaminase RidA (YjgF/YER057c/UK114 family)